MWTWMKRYRVWQANREVFLWPENWLYPELRDDQSPFFKTIMSKLLQSDITDDTAAYAYLEYLSDLESVAKLEICAMYYVPSTTTTTNSVVHVVGRTAGAKRTYFYRYFDGAAWAPWQQIPLTIDDNPVLLVVWNSRLLLFWLQFIQNPIQTTAGPGGGSSSASSLVLTDSGTTIGDLTSGLSTLTPDPSAAGVTIYYNLFWSEYYNGKWQPAKSSDTNNPGAFGSAPSSGPAKFDRTQVDFNAYPDPDRSQNRLWLTLFGPNEFSTAFPFYNTHSAPVFDPTGFPESVESPNPYARYITCDSLSGAWGTPQIGPWVLQTGYSYDDGTNSSDFEFYLISTNVIPVVASVAVPQGPIDPDPSGIDWWMPFVFEDTCNVFYVETAMNCVRAGDYLDYGIVAYVPPVASQVPPLVLKNAALLGTSYQDRPPSKRAKPSAASMRRRSRVRDRGRLCHARPRLDGCGALR